VLFDIYVSTPSTDTPVRLVAREFDAPDGDAAIRQAVQADAGDDGRRESNRVYSSYPVSTRTTLRSVIRLVSAS